MLDRESGMTDDVLTFIITVRWWNVKVREIIWGHHTQNSMHGRMENRTEKWNYSGSLNQYRNNSVLKVRGCVLAWFHCYTLQVPGAA